MDILRVTVIGKNLFDIVKEKLELVGFNNVNRTKSGMLGNLTTLTYFLEIEPSEVIEKRKKLMLEIARDEHRLMGLYPHGDWMRIIVMRPFEY